MKIGIDARLWNESGVGRYIRNLILNLEKIDKNNSYVLFVKEGDAKNIEQTLGGKFKIVSFNSGWHSISEQINFPKVIGRENLDLMHFPYSSMPVFYRSAYVLTIHDLIPYHYATGEASTLPYWLYGFKILGYRYVINNGAWNARKVIAVSNFTKDDIIDHLRVHKRDVEVTYEGTDDFKPKVKHESKDKFFLYVGNVYPHKNAHKLVEAFENFSKNYPGYSLIFAGREDEFYRRFQKPYKKLAEKGLVSFEYNVSDERLAELYGSAIALVRPSLMEGFSLPPLEAMKSGCVVLASDIPVPKRLVLCFLTRP